MSFYRIKLIFDSRYYSRPIQPHFRKIFRTEPKTEPPDIFKFWDFQKLKFKKWENSLPFLKISKFENIGGLRFGLRSEYFSKMRLSRSWILSGIKNQLDSIKTHISIPLWSALTQIFKKVIGHFQFWSPEWGSRAPKIDFSQHSYSQEAKKISRKDTTIIFCSSESWHSVLFKYVKIGAQNGAPEWQFSVDWKRCNSNLRQILGVFLV